MKLQTQINTLQGSLDRLDNLIENGVPRKPLTSRQLEWWKELRAGVAVKIIKLAK